LVGIAAGLGSDVPFFLHGGTALATGRGERLAPLPTPAFTAVVVYPKIRIPRKTATLYGALRPDDFSDGARVLAQADRLRAGLPPDPICSATPSPVPSTAFARKLADLPPLMRANGAAHPAISGAGPSHYALFEDPEEAVAVAQRLEPCDGQRGRDRRRGHPGKNPFGSPSRAVVRSRVEAPFPAAPRAPPPPWHRARDRGKGPAQREVEATTRVSR
jgi:4-diphosphocytidyl-2C-methyl-D-erythritol kinase